MFADKIDEQTKNAMKQNQKKIKMNESKKKNGSQIVLSVFWRSVWKLILFSLPFSLVIRENRKIKKIKSKNAT